MHVHRLQLGVGLARAADEARGVALLPRVDADHVLAVLRVLDVGHVVVEQVRARPPHVAHDAGGFADDAAVLAEDFSRRRLCARAEGPLLVHGAPGELHLLWKDEDCVARASLITADLLLALLDLPAREGVHGITAVALVVVLVVAHFLRQAHEIVNQSNGLESEHESKRSNEVFSVAAVFICSEHEGVLLEEVSAHGSGEDAELVAVLRLDQVANLHEVARELVPEVHRRHELQLRNDFTDELFFGCLCLLGRGLGALLARGRVGGGAAAGPAPALRRSLLLLRRRRWLRFGLRISLCFRPVL
mmetsp:Transcript_14205/g.55903  ORF Transcript_14205/g.55903 Transcript_14205/m.55903 type:complete len:304 (+) Transcript_14205:720-1631(+)